MVLWSAELKQRCRYSTRQGCRYSTTSILTNHMEPQCKSKYIHVVPGPLHGRTPSTSPSAVEGTAPGPTKRRSCPDSRSLRGGALALEGDAAVARGIVTTTASCSRSRSSTALATLRKTDSICPGEEEGEGVDRGWARKKCEHCQPSRYRPDITR